MKNGKLKCGVQYYLKNLKNTKKYWIKVGKSTLTKIKMINKQERKLIFEAIDKARQAYDKTLEKANVDGAYYEMDITIKIMNSQFEVLHTIEDKENVLRIDKGK